MNDQPKVSEFTPGAVVRLKSGGPWMTVVRPSTYQNNHVLVVWFDGCLHSADIAAVALEAHE